MRVEKKAGINLQLFAQKIDYATKYTGAVDERFEKESVTQDIVNQNYDWSGAKTVAVYDVSTASMNDYDRTGEKGNFSRYGKIENLNAEAEEMTLTQDRSFTFAIDKMDEDETAGALEAGKALARQLREVTIPEVDQYRLDKMVAEAGHKKEGELTKDNIYEAILDATVALDDAKVPVMDRTIVVTPEVYKLMKQSKDIILDEEVSKEERQKGIIAEIDGMKVKRVPSSRVSAENFQFLVTHSICTVAPIKLAEYKIHKDPVGISGSLVEGRVYYDAFVLKNKKAGIYLQTKGA